MQPRKYVAAEDYEPLPDPDVPASGEAVDSNQQGGNLADGVYDEAANARAFQDALSEWRTGKPSNGPSNGPSIVKPQPRRAPKGRSEGGSQTGGPQARGGIKVIMARPAGILTRISPSCLHFLCSFGEYFFTGQGMRCSTPEHEKEGVNTIYASLPAPVGPQGPMSRQMAMLQQDGEGGGGGCGGGQQYSSYKPPSGAASLGGGGVDEEANKKEFASAMSDWRSRKGPIKIVYE